MFLSLQSFGVYKRNYIDQGDFRARLPNEPGAPPSYSPESSSSGYAVVKVNNEIKIIPPPPPYTPPTIHQSPNIRTTEMRRDEVNNIKPKDKIVVNDKTDGNDANAKKQNKEVKKDKDKKDKKEEKEKNKKTKYIRIKKDEKKPVPKTPIQNQAKPAEVHNKVLTSPPAQTVNPKFTKVRAAAPLLVPPTPAAAASVPENATPKSTPKQKGEAPKPIAPTQSPPKVIEFENPAMMAKLNSMPTTFIKLDGFDSNETDDLASPPPTIRSVHFHDVYDVKASDQNNNNNASAASYDDPIVFTSSPSTTSNTVYNDKIEILTLTADDDLFPKMQPRPRTTGINYLEYQSSNHNDSETDDGESKFNDDYEFAPLAFLSKQPPPLPTSLPPTIKPSDTTLVIAPAATATQNGTKQIYNKNTTMTTTTTTMRDEKKFAVADNKNVDDDDDDNMWDLVAQHRKSVGRKMERDQSVNVNGIMKTKHTAVRNRVADKPKTLREIHNQSRDNTKKAQQLQEQSKATSKSNAIVMMDELGDEADA